MSKKWSSSKKVSVNGIAFKRARLAFKNEDEGPKRGEYGHGSQEWLAELARVSPRTINELESGRGTLKTVDTVSNVLSIQGREFIRGYGADFTTLRATDVVDFRPTINGRLPDNETLYLNSPFLLTLDPLVITVDDDFIDSAKLQRMSLRLSVGDMIIDFSWLYNVQLISSSSTWLGDEEDVSEIDIITREPYQQPIMFKQNSFPAIVWKDFIEHIVSTDESRILLTVTLTFEHFEKQDNILVAVKELKGLFEAAYPQGCPYWVQPNALMV